MEIIDHGHDIIEYSEAIPNISTIIDNILKLDADKNIYPVMPPFEEWKEGAHDENGNFVYQFLKGRKKLIHMGREAVENPEAAKIVKEMVVDPICIPLDECIRHYAEAVGVQSEPASRNLDIRLYDTGMGLGPHGDINQDFQNEFSFVVYLNDDYEGGELKFNDKDITIKPKAGSVVGFRSLEIHESLPTTSGIKWHIPYFWYLGVGSVMCNKETPLLNWDEYFSKK
jgi:hypothetical protein